MKKSIEKKLQKIIKSSTFEIEKGRFVYVKVASISGIDKHFLISKDKDEITVITREENLSALNIVEKNKDCYKLIALKVSLPFYAIGFLATISSAIAEKGMNILIVSTYSKDYIMVREEHLGKTKEILLSLGFKRNLGK